MKLRIQSKSAASQRRRRARLRNRGICFDCARKPAEKSGRCMPCYTRKLTTGNNAAKAKRRAKREAAKAQGEQQPEQG